jgi:hypothetical protein
VVVGASYTDIQIWQLHEKFAAVLLNLLLDCVLVFHHESEVMQARPVWATAAPLVSSGKCRSVRFITPSWFRAPAGC